MAPTNTTVCYGPEFNPRPQPCCIYKCRHTPLSLPKDKIPLWQGILFCKPFLLSSFLSSTHLQRFKEILKRYWTNLPVSIKCDSPQASSSSGVCKCWLQSCKLNQGKDQLYCPFPQCKCTLALSSLGLCFQTSSSSQSQLKPLISLNYYRIYWFSWLKLSPGLYMI